VTPPEMAMGREGFNPRKPGTVENMTQDDWERVGQRYERQQGDISFSRGLGAGLAARDLPAVPGTVRVTLAGLETGLIQAEQIMDQYSESFTGLEAPLYSLAARMGLAGTVEFSEFRAGAQIMYGKLRRELIGSAQSAGELETLKRALPADATALSDTEFLGVFRTTVQIAKTTIMSLSRQFKLPLPEILDKPLGLGRQEKPKIGDKKTFANGSVGVWGVAEDGVERWIKQ